MLFVSVRYVYSLQTKFLSYIYLISHLDVDLTSGFSISQSWMKYMKCVFHLLFSLYFPYFSFFLYFFMFCQNVGDRMLRLWPHYPYKLRSTYEERFSCGGGTMKCSNGGKKKPENCQKHLFGKAEKGKTC